jgi:hypothetical protein
MPRGGSRGGGRPKSPPEMLKKTAAYSLSPILIKTILEAAKAQGISKSELVGTILIAYFAE